MTATTALPVLQNGKKALLGDLIDVESEVREILSQLLEGHSARGSGSQLHFCARSVGTPI